MKLKAFLLLLLLFSEYLSSGSKNPILGEAGLDILSWNIYMLPRVALRHGKASRAKAIVEDLTPGEFEVIVFQEAFLPRARRIIAKGLNTVYPYQYGPANPKSGLKCNSGVWIISKVPMRLLKTIQFRDCKLNDCFARKGAMLLEGEWNGKKFQILGTHLQAGNYPKVRSKQMDQIYEELLSPYKQDGVPQIICGDMNTEIELRGWYCNMLDCLHAEDGSLLGSQKYTYDGIANPIAQSLGGRIQTTYDYILLCNNGARIKTASRFVSILKKGTKNLSDHFGVACKVDFEN